MNTSGGQVVLTPSHVSSVSQLPALGRQLVPAVAGPALTQTGDPVLQSVVPSSQGLPVEHGAPALHAPQPPSPSQNPPAHIVPAAEKPSGGHAVPTPSQVSSTSQASIAARHVVPGGAAPAATQTGDPLVQSTIPSSQGLPVEHGAPSMQIVVHVPPPSHSPDGHGVPSGANASVGQVVPDPSQLSARSQTPVDGRQTDPAGAAPVGSHTGEPPAHRVVPASHTLVVQASPSTQTVQPPRSSQASPAPHRVPGGRSSISMHAPAPPTLQSVIPRVQGFPVSQVAPGTHSLQVPAPEQVPDVPQGLPDGTSSVATQTGMSETQSVSPLVQGLPVSQVVPSVQVLHAPELAQASPGPQDVPGGRSVDATHAPGSPLEQSITPRVHGSPVSQVVPSTHSLQVPPPEQIPATPHGVPDGRLCRGMQTGPPEPQSMRPSSHGLPVSQTTSGVQSAQTPASSHANPTPH
jgi:hypothetical protein